MDVSTAITISIGLNIKISINIVLNPLASGVYWQTLVYMTESKSFAVAERPPDARSQFKSCQLLHSFTKNRICKGLRQVNDLERP